MVRVSLSHFLNAVKEYICSEVISEEIVRRYFIKRIFKEKEERAKRIKVVMVMDG